MQQKLVKSLYQRPTAGRDNKKGKSLERIYSAGVVKLFVF